MTEKIRTYFERLASEHTLIKQFFSGTYSDMLSGKLNEILYPCLWFEAPDIKFSSTDEDSFLPTYDATFLVLINAQADDPAQLRHNLYLSELIALDLVKRANCDQESETLGFRLNSVRMSQAIAITDDNCQGYRVELEATPYNTENDYASRFNSLFPAGATAAFTFTESEAGGVKTITLTNKALPDISNYTFEYYFSDGAANQTNTEDENPVFTTSSESYYIRLRLTVNGVTLTATANRNAGFPGVRFSVPFEYNPLNF